MERLDHPFPPPHFSDAKMARFFSFAPSSLLCGERGRGRKLIVPFYSVALGQSCIKIISDKSNVVATDRNLSDC